MRLKTKLELLEIALERLNKATTHVKDAKRGRNMYGLEGTLQEQIDDLQCIIQEISIKQMELEAQRSNRWHMLLDYLGVEEVEAHTELRKKDG